MRLIPLPHGRAAIVDDDDYEAVAGWHWSWSPSKGYACRSVLKKNGGSTTLYLHRILVAAPPGAMVDHINRDRLDCRRSNLRFVTWAQNSMNSSLRRDNHAGFKGVIFRRDSGKWRARIYLGGRHRHLGTYATAAEAAAAYDGAARRYFGEYAAPNGTL